MSQFPVVRYPEWKTLTDRIGPLLDQGQSIFTYTELTELAGIDIRSSRGRQQFYRFRNHILRERRLWFEVVIGDGYQVIPANDQPRSASRRLDQSRRKMRMAKAINTFVRLEEMSPEQRLAQSAMAAVLNNVGRAFLRASKDLKQVSNADLSKIDQAQVVKSIKRLM
jgi:hypothetical protein